MKDQPGPTSSVPIRTRPRGVVIACMVAAGVLAATMIPGVLLYPGPRPSLDERVLVALQKEANRALAQQVAQMSRDLSREVCVAEGRLMLREPDGATRPISTTDETALPPPPVERIAAPPSGTANRVRPPRDRSLADLLDNATVLVIAQNMGETSIGSGFFVAPGLIVTNLHVLDDPPASEIWVTSRALDRMTRARLMARTGRVEIGQPDFALLGIDPDEAVETLALASSADRLQNVIAAGFPALVMDTDAGFRRLRAGDPAAVPEMAVSQGIITARQSPSGTPLILHTASMSSGNSGGPLVDQCGRVVGVNTFVRAEQEEAARMNYALAAEALATFLAGAGVDIAVASDLCRPNELGEAR